MQNKLSYGLILMLLAVTLVAMGLHGCSEGTSSATSHPGLRHFSFELMALAAGAAVGTIAGFWFAPADKTEEGKFSDFAKGASAVVTGALIGQISNRLLSNDHLHMILPYFCCAVVGVSVAFALTVFIRKSY